MIGLSVADIFMRNVFNSGVSIAPPLVRIMVLWLGLLGALYATRRNKHITVDVLARMLPKKLNTVAKGVTSLFASAICLIIAWHSYLFVKDTFTYGDIVFDDTPAWIIQAIIPLSFSLISVRFCGHSLGYFFITDYQPAQNVLNKNDLPP